MKASSATHVFFRSTMAAALLLTSLSSFGQDSSIKMIDASTFSIDQAEMDAIKAQMQAAVDSGHLPGALLMVGNNDGVGVMLSVGTQGPGDSTPIDQETIFRIYSMTKPIISVAAMSLVEDGLLNVEDPVGKYIPEFNDMQVINSETGAVTAAQNVMTVEHLLTHKSGLIQAIFSPDTALGKMYMEQIPSDGSLTALETAKRLGQL
ncbi:MAG: serine hydrolase domain-containing protein, partial [Pseudohongiellaceae bacterium]